MSLHIEARPGDIAETVLIAGDPRRARHVAETMLEETKCFNEVRNMNGFTGRFKGKRVSVMGTGMGMASTAIYLHELMTDYKIKKVIRIGTCGCIQPGLALGDVVLAMGASTDSNINRSAFDGFDFAALANYPLLALAQKTADSMGIQTTVGNVLSTDLFYHPEDPLRYQVWIDHQVLCVEMETAIVYTMAARFGIQALSLLTVSDNILSGESATVADREGAFGDMVRIALALV